MKISKSAYLQYFFISLAANLIIALNTSVKEPAGGYGVIIAVLNIFSVSVLIIAAIGLLGTLLIHISNNQKNIALRIACGAGAKDIVILVLINFTLKPAVIPAILGTALAQAVLRQEYIQSSFGIASLPIFTAPVSLFLIVAFLLLTALTAVLKAVNINAALTLKGE